MSDLCRVSASADSIKNSGFNLHDDVIMTSDIYWSLTNVGDQLNFYPCAVMLLAWYPPPFVLTHKF